MANTELDIVARLMANIGSPDVVAAIDRALDEIERQKVELAELRKMAVRRHGEGRASTPPPKAERYDDQGMPLTQSEIALTDFTDVHGTVAWLVDRYRKDSDSPYHVKAFATRSHYETLTRRLLLTCASVRLAEIDARMLLRLYEQWSDGGKVATGHAMIGMVRILMNFGGSILSDPECVRIASVLQKMRFPVATRRDAPGLTENYVRAIIEKAHTMGFPSIALAQALQFDCKLRQKDVIGEWVPEAEPFVTDVVHNGMKWIRGLRWSEIDDQFVIRSPKNRRSGIDLKKAPLVMAEFDKIKGGPGKDGPMIIYEINGLPYHGAQYRKTWRKIANAAGVPKGVKNMDSRVDD